MLPVFPLAVLAIAGKVNRARPLSPARLVDQPAPAGAGSGVPPVAGPARIAAELRAISDELSALSASATQSTDLEQVLDRACARIEEWSL